jgi:hypothetical protein
MITLPGAGDTVGGVRAGDRIRCPQCGKPHTLKAAINSKGEKTEVLMSYTCPETQGVFLGAVDGWLVGSLHLNEE